MKGSYIAFGDSISIDEYPALDHGLVETSKVGAASRFGGWLVSSAYVDDAFYMVKDGATISDVLKHQIRKIPSSVRHKVNIITLTTGGNDISFAGMQWQRTKKDQFQYQLAMERIKDEYKELCRTIREKFPHSFVIVNSLYDPTDGLGKLPNCGSWSAIADWYSRGRRELGTYILSRDPLPDEKFLTCDIFALFDGHGMAEPVWGRRWYYEDFMIEPGYAGALAIAKQWRYVLRRHPAFHEYSQQDFTFSR